MPGSNDERKERVIHSRVPESLDDEIKAKAQRLGLSVSNLVRNVLENAFGLVEDIVADGADIARAAQEGRPGKAARPGARTRAAAATDALAGTPEAAVLGWQPAVLELNAVCERCNAILPRGSEASIGISAGGPPSFRCRDCVPAAPAPSDAAAPNEPDESARTEEGVRHDG